ncbi:MAG: hypothetical protein U0795_11625 [Pirellulales bacterium]
MPAPVLRRPSRLAGRFSTPAVPIANETPALQQGDWPWLSTGCAAWSRWAVAGAVLCLLPLGWASWHAPASHHGLAATTDSPLLAQLELGPAHDHPEPPPAPELPDGPADPPAAAETEETVPAEDQPTDETASEAVPDDGAAETDAGSAQYDDRPSADQGADEATDGSDKTESQADGEPASPTVNPQADSKSAPSSTQSRPNSAPNSAPKTAPPRPVPQAAPGHNRRPGSSQPSATPPGKANPDGASEAESNKLAPPPTAPRQLSPRQQALKHQLEQCLQFYFVNKPLNTRDDSAWSIMHSFLGFGAPTPVAVGSPQGQRANAIAWMCANKPCGGRELLYIQNGLVIGREGPGYQGHPAQFLAMLAQVHVSPNYELRVANQRLTVQNLIESEKVTCRDGMELTFKLISLSHYLESTATWQNQQGQTWDIPRLIRAEISQPINGAACGGTHRLMGLSCAIYNRQQEGLPIDGQWARADKYIRDYHRYTFSLQNPDGSFSSDWFKRRANWGENDRKLQTTGHIAEWMIYSVPEDELHDQRLFRAVQLLVNLMSQNRHYDWAVGPRGHAIRALRLYHERALGGRPADWMGGQMTRRAVSRAR